MSIMVTSVMNMTVTDEDKLTETHTVSNITIVGSHLQWQSEDFSYGPESGSVDLSKVHSVTLSPANPSVSGGGQ
jgi:hypothetical protein